MANIRTGNGWTVANVDSSNAGDSGLKLVGTGTTVSGGKYHDNALYGISGAGSMNSTVTGATIGPNNNTSCTPTGGNPGASATKFTGTSGLTLSNNIVSDNRGNGLWLDETNTLISGNTVTNNVKTCGGGFGIRVEISCNATVVSNTVTGNEAAGIMIINSFRNTVGQVGAPNIVSVPSNGTAGLKSQADRSGTYGSLCGGGAFNANNNTFTANTVTLTTTSQNTGTAWFSPGGSLTGNSFAGNTYVVPSCTAKLWRWWDGSVLNSVAFGPPNPSWQGYNQDLTGSCRVG